MAATTRHDAGLRRDPRAWGHAGCSGWDAGCGARAIRARPELDASAIVSARVLGRSACEAEGLPERGMSERSGVRKERREIFMALSRRDFLKVGGSACIVAGAGAALAGCSPSGGSPDSPKPAEGGADASVVGYEPVSFDQETDILIIGTGYAGLAAAMAPALAGKKIVLAEKQQMMGGDSAGSCCFMFANGTQLSSTPAFPRPSTSIGKEPRKSRPPASTSTTGTPSGSRARRTPTRSSSIPPSTTSARSSRSPLPTKSSRVWRRASSCRATASARAASTS